MKTISVGGIRGKSFLVETLSDALRNRGLSVYSKITGDIPFVYDGSRKIEINRENHKGVLYENLRLPKSGYDALVVENQGVSPYTCRMFNRMVNPDIGIITNVRLDHTESLGRNLEEIKRSFIYAYEDVPVVLIGNGKPGKIPKTELLPLVNKVLTLMELPSLSVKEENSIFETIKLELTPKRLSSRDILYFNGSKINDVTSTEEIYNYLKKIYNMKFTIFANLRHDRVGRTNTFLPFFVKCILDGDRVVLHGRGSTGVVKYLMGCGFNKESVFALEDVTPTRAVDILLDYSSGRILFSACNGATEFMREVNNKISNYIDRHV